MKSLPYLTDAQLGIVRYLINAPRNTIVEDYRHTGSEIPLYAHFYCAAKYFVGRVPPEQNVSIIALIRKGVLVSNLSNKEFAVQYALGLQIARQYHLTNRQRWEDKLK